MNLLTNGFMNNCGRLFGPSEQFEADIVELGLQGFAGAALSVACQIGNFQKTDDY